MDARVTYCASGDAKFEISLETQENILVFKYQDAKLSANTPVSSC